MEAQRIKNSQDRFEEESVGGGGSLPDQGYQEFIEPQKMRQCGIGIGRVK